MRKSLLIALALINFTQLSYSQSSKQEKEISDVLEKLLTAFNKYDGATIKSLLMDEPFVRVIQSGVIHEPSFYQTISPDIIEKSRITVESKWANKSVRIIDSETAVVVGKILTITTPRDEESFETKSINSIILQKKNGDWKIVTIHSSSLKESRNF